MKLNGILLSLVGVLLLTACGVNPVTGKQELQFVSEAQELDIGAKNYSPTRQSEGGDFTVVPELTTYINEVGQKLAKVSDRQLPYEFVVLNNSVPNAWALPGGKIAVNRGLLTELKNEAELAAVLGHEIVHAAARHGAKAQERGTLLQAGMAAAQIGAAVGGVDANIAGLMIQGAGVGAQLIQTTYGRDQELESDLYGMKYMKLAGYDPWGAVTLQETFVRLSEQGGRQQGWLDGLFASHPPSAERVAQNQKTAAGLGRGGEVGAEQYVARLKPLVALKPAYDKYDQAVAAAGKKDFATAKKLANEAATAVPKEGRFQQFLGEVALSEKQPQQAITHYTRAIDLNPEYFGSYLGAGVAQLQAGNRAKAEEWLKQSAQLLPTAPAAFYLGQIEREKGNLSGALQYYKAAAGSNSAIATGGQLDARGQLVVMIQNRAPVALANIQVTPVQVDVNGGVVSQGAAVRIRGPVAAGAQAAAPTNITLTQEQLALIRFRVDGAQAQ
jgi:predicted Zn-dependent protease